MRTDLWDDPRVSALCDSLEIDEARVIGGLYRLWSIADAHSTDGLLRGMALAAVDRKIGIPGFAEALQAVSWLTVGSDGIVIPEFTIHNGQSAKSRAQASVRQQSRRALNKPSRSARDETATVSNQSRDTGASRIEEKEIKEDPPPPCERGEPKAGPFNAGKGAAGRSFDRGSGQADAWAEVVTELDSLGMADALGTVEAARGKALTPKDVLAVVAEYRERKAEFRGPGAIHWRLTRERWPVDEPEPDPVQSDRQRRENEHGKQLDSLRMPDLESLCRAAGVSFEREDSRARHESRQRLLAQLDRQTTA